MPLVPSRERPTRARPRWAVLVLLAALCFGSTPAQASSTRLSYTRLQVYSGALRFLRIDKGYAITERDPDAAYLLFEYPAPNQQQSFGAFEIIETDGAIQLSVKLPKMPSYHEDVLRDELVRKLRQDYGEPSPRSDKRQKDDKKPKSAEDEGTPKRRDGTDERGPEHAPSEPRRDDDSAPSETGVAPLLPDP